MVATSSFNRHLRVCLGLGLFLLFVFCVRDTRAQTATYRLHREASTTANLFQLKTNNPDAASLAIQSANLKNKPAGEYVIKAFDTQTGVPNATGTIPAGATVTFSLWLKRTGTGGTMFPRARLQLNSAAGTTIAVADGPTALTTTLVKYTFTGTVPANVTLTAADRFHLWVGVNLTAAPTQNSVAELDVEGTLNGNYDSTLTVPLPSPPPSITDLTPNSGAVGAAVTVAGTNFGTTQGASTITFNGTAATPTSWNATSIVAPVPAGATTGPVVVTLGGQASNGLTFTVASTGTIAGTITRASDGAVVSGALVEALQAGVVKGSTTSAANGSYSLVDLAPGTYDLRTVALGYQTQLQNGVVVTAGNTTTANQGLDVLSPTGDIEYIYDEVGRLVAMVTAAETVIYTYDAVGNLLSISRGATAQVSIIEFTPNNGSVGTTVTLYGTGFSAVAGENAVQFNGVTATVTSATPTRIVTSVPAGATTGPISVTSPTGNATSSTPFTVGTPGGPTITGFTPTIGTVGTSVTITGTNFELSPYSTKAKFNKTIASITSATTTELVTSVPALAASGRITVDTVVGSAVTNDDFFIVPSPRTVADVGMTGRMAINESKVVTIPAPGKIALIVFDGVAGQSVSIGTSNSTISATGCCSSSKVTIYRPDGTALLPPTDFYQAGGGTPSVQLPVSGTYTILVEPFSNLVGSVTLWLSQDLSSPIIINGPSVTLTNLTGQNARLPFSGTAGQWVSVGVSNTTIGAVSCCTTSKVSIVKPDGTALLAPFDFYQVGAGTPSVQLPVSGTYYVVIDPVNGVAGNATITLSEDLSPPISVNGPAVTLTNRIGQNARLLFSGNAGQWISVGVSDVTIGAVSCCTTSKVSILKPDGTALLAPFDIYHVGAGTPSVQLPTSGTYTIIVDPYNAVAGVATITLSDDLSPAISIDGPAVTLTNRAGQNARLTFSGTAGQWIGLGVSDVTIGAPSCCSTSKVAIYKPDGTALFPVTDFYGPMGTPSLQLPTSGTYTIVVDPYHAVAGNATLTLSEDLSPPISINGGGVTLTNRAGQNARLSFTGNAGQWISLAVTDVTIAATQCCVSSTVAIYKPDGTALVGPLTIPAAGVTTPSVQLPVSGNYIMVVDPYNAVAGNATVALWEDLSPPITINGPQVVLQFTNVGQNSRLFFSGTAGQWVSVGTSDSTISATGCCASSTVTLLKPDGTTLLAPFTFFQAGGGTPSVQLPVTGTYALIVEPFNNMLGSVTLWLSEDLAPPISINGPAVVLTNRVGQNARLPFSGNAGQWISVGVSDTTIGAASCCTTSKVSILRPDGTTLLAPFEFYQQGNGTPSVQLPVSGTYYVVVDPINGVAGNATVTLSEDLAPSISINGSSVVLTHRVGQNARLPFSGNAGQWISVGVSNTTLGAPFCCTTSKVSILKPDGTALLAPLDFYHQGTGTPSLQLPVSGAYTIIVDPYLAVAGNATITLSEDLAPPISINGPSVTLTNRPGQNARLTFSGTAGQPLSLGVTDVTIGAPSCCTTSKVAIYKPDGTPLFAPIDFYGPVGTDTIQLPTSGTYTLIVDPYLAVAGTATITLSEDLVQVMTPGGPSFFMNFRAGQNGIGTFGAAAGQRITIRVWGNTVGMTAVTLTGAGGMQFTSGTSGSGTFSLATQTLPSTGTYTVTVNPTTTNTGALNLVVEDPDLNMALNKTATQSSTNFSAPASRAVDGNTDGNFSNGSVTHTQVENQAWWHVDLGSVQSIGKIDVFNRTDCCSSALTNFYVFVSDVPFTSTDVTATQNQAGVFTYQHNGQGGSPTSVTVNRTGRYVRIQLPGSERLSLAEVQVWPQ